MCFSNLCINLLVYFTPFKVEAMDEQIRKLSSASGQSLNGNKSGSGSLQDSLGALPFGSGLLDAQGKPLANFNRSPSGSSESVSE
jgi:hypothetical protein